MNERVIIDRTTPVYRQTSSRQNPRRYHNSPSTTKPLLRVILPYLKLCLLNCCKQCFSVFYPFLCIRDDREWLFTFPLPTIPMQSVPIRSHSHSQFCNQFPFPWDSHKAVPIPSHFHSRTLHRCSINYFRAREDSSLNMPLKLTISCMHFYSTETRKIVVEKIISFDL